jgi:hypothetical protein
MKTIVTVCIAFGALVTACTMQSNAQTREERSVSNEFTEISVSSGIDLFVKQGEPVEIIVEAANDFMGKVKTEVKGNTLNVYVEGGVFSWFQSHSAKVHVTVPEISKLASSGGADLKSVGEIVSDQIEIVSSGGADAEVTLKASTVVLKCSGGADIVARGKADFLEASASGGADIKARQLLAKKVEASASGGADVTVFASVEIKASASGGADVDYYGSPGMKNVNSSGGGDVKGH